MSHIFTSLSVRFFKNSSYRIKVYWLVPGLSSLHWRCHSKALERLSRYIMPWNSQMRIRPQ